MVIYLIGFPLFTGLILRTGLPGSGYFITAYFFLMCSNIFTVVEEFGLNSFFNSCEHISITIGAVAMLMAIIQFTHHDKEKSGFPDNGRTQ